MSEMEMTNGKGTIGRRMEAEPGRKAPAFRNISADSPWPAPPMRWDFDRGPLTGDAHRRRDVDATLMRRS